MKNSQVLDQSQRRRPSDKDALVGRAPHEVVCPLAGSSTVDLLIYQTLCYAQEDLDVDVEQYLLKVCGQAEFLSK